MGHLPAPGLTDATQAARRAGYNPPTARQQGQPLLTDVVIQNRLSEAQEARKEHARIASDRLEREAERIAVSDVRRLVRDGQLLPVKDIPDDLAPAIASMKPNDVSLLRCPNSTVRRLFDQPSVACVDWVPEECTS